MDSEHQKLQSLLAALCDGRLSRPDWQRLTAMLESSRHARRFYIEYMHLHSGLGRYAGGDCVEPEAPACPTSITPPLLDAEAVGPVDDTSVGDIVTSVGDIVAPEVNASVWQWFGLFTSAKVATVCVALILLGIVSFATFNRERVAVVPVENSPQPQGPVARLLSKNCVWLDDEEPIKVGAEIRSGARLKLMEGFARLVFAEDATVILQGPAVIEPLTTTSLRLVYGSVVVRTNGPRNDFTVISPEASIVDLGTSFGVHATEEGSTEIEVFEGTVEVYAGTDSRDGHVLGLGESALVRHNEGGMSIDKISSSEDRFSRLCEVLWANIPGDDGGHEGKGAVVKADFSEAPVPKTVDTFYGSRRGRGWISSWLARGKPVGEVRREDALSGENNPYLALKFGESRARLVARAYGSRSEFDPREPHVITWRWRFDGDINQFGGHYRDRVLFYSGPSFYNNTNGNLSWIIGVMGAAEEPPPGRGPHIRHFYPSRWFFYDRRDEGGGKLLDGLDMVDSGMELKQGVIYKFAVVVYPEEGRYDAAIQDDEQTFVRTGLKFRDPKIPRYNVLHFNLRTAERKTDLGFSLDSVRIEPLENRGLRQIMQP